MPLKGTLIYQYMCWAVYGVFGAGLLAQEVQETQRIVVIEVPVQVVRNGGPVTGLKKEQFTLFDNGRRQEILNLEEVVWERTSGVQIEQQSPENMRPSDRRHFLLLFDLFFSDRFSLRKASKSALDLVQNGLHPEDLVSVVMFKPNDGVIVFTGFTDDRERVLKALNQLNEMTHPKRQRQLAKQLKQVNFKKYDPLLLASGSENKLIPGIAYQQKLEAARVAINDRGGTLGGMKLLKKELAKMAHMVDVGIPNGAGEGAIRLSYSASLLANAFRDIEGRKYMVLLSQGFSNSLLTDERYGGMVRSHQESMFRVFRQTGWAVHAIDIKGLRPNGANISQDSLFQMAADTGGKFYKNYTDPAEAFEKLVTNTSVVYRLSFAPDPLAFDGSYHRIKVKLKNASLGTRIQYARSGYFAPKPEGSVEELSPAEKAALILGEAEVDRLETGLTSQPIYTVKGQTKIAVLLESKGEALLAEHEGPELELEAFVYALNEAREIIDFSVQSFSLNLGKNKFMMTRSPRIFANLNLPPGSYELRYLLLNTLTQSYSLGTHAIAVPDMSVGEPVFPPPIFPRTFDQGILVNLCAEKFIFEQQEYPYVAGDYLYIPRVFPKLKAKNRQPLVLSILEQGKGKWRFFYRITDTQGQTLDEGKLKTERASSIRENGVYKILGQLNLKGFADGPYLLEIKALDTKRNVELVQTIDFEIGDPGQY